MFKLLNWNFCIPGNILHVIKIRAEIAKHLVLLSQTKLSQIWCFSSLQNLFVYLQRKSKVKKKTKHQLFFFSQGIMFKIIK